MTTRKPSLLITGGAGFIGSTLVRQCLAEGDSLVVNLDKFTYVGQRSAAQAHRARDGRLGHDRRYAVCAKKVRETTGWQPTVSFSVGLRETVA